VVATAGLLFVVVVLLARPILRNIGVSLQGIQALAQIIAVWIAFLGLGIVELQRRHIRIEYFFEKLAPVLQRRVNVAIVAMCLFVTAVIPLSAVFAVRALGGATIPTLGIPAATIHAAPIIGVTLLFVIYLERFRTALTELQSNG